MYHEIMRRKVNILMVDLVVGSVNSAVGGDAKHSV
jgi:hypothetical protein